MIKRAALYMRVSSDKQARDGDSIPAQRDALRAYALSHNMEIVGEYLDEGLSGTKYYERDDLQRMLSDVRAGRIDIILFTKLDRFYRSIRHYTATQAVLDEFGVGWLAIWESVYDTTTPAGRLIVNQMMSIAQFEAENTGARIRSVFDYKLKNHEVISGNMTPGYSIKNKHLVPNEDAADVLRAFRVYDQTGSLRDTCLALTGSALPTTTSGIKNLLSRPIYTGEYHGIPDFCPAIVDRELFDRVQIALSRNIKPTQKYTYLFSGLITCAECGAKMAGYQYTKRGHHYANYRCAKYYQRAVRTCCNKKIISEKVLEEYLLDNLPKLVLDAIDAADRAQDPIRDLEQKRAAISRKIDRLKTLYISDEITLEEYRHDKAELLAAAAALDPVPSINVNVDALRDLVGLNVREIYETFSHEERRMFWRGIIKGIRFDSSRNFFIDFF